MREITSHRGSSLNNGLKIYASDEPGPGGANQCYLIHVDEINFTTPPGVTVSDVLQFHKGNPADGITGISNEALLAIVEDRLKGFQSGPFACDTNAMALSSVGAALAVLRARSAERTARGVEGTQEK